MLCNKIGLITVIALLVIDVGNSQFSTKLTCVRITECPSILELLKRRPVTPYIIKLIRTSSCGFDGHIEKVWCPKVHNVSTTTTEEPITEEPATETLTTEEPTTEEPTTETIEIFEKLVLPNSTDPIPRKNHFPIDLCNNGIAFKVMGGTSTDIDQYPWMALLQYENSKTKKLYNGCAGALLSHRYVLTAAHCITTRKPPVKVILGEYDTKNETDCVLLPAGEEDCAPPVIESSIEKVHVHPEWLVDHRRPFYHDIAVIRLASSVEFSDFVNPICMPSSKMKKPTSEDLVVAGWGRTNDGKSSTVKQQLVLPAFPNLECSRVHRKDIIESQICAGGVAGKDTCVGDSGGPLMSFDRTSGIWQVLGIVSLSSRGCGLEGVPGIYTYVPKYVDWINSVVTP